MTGCCSFCDQAAGVREGDELGRLLGHRVYKRTMLIENPAAVAMPSIGPLAVGHVLICPRRHARSCAELNPEEWGAVAELAAQAEQTLTRALNLSVVAFEHGSATTGVRVACSVEHAHLHLLPWPADPWPYLPSGLVWRPVEAGHRLADATAGREYLRVRCADGWRVSFAPQHGFESQLMRRLLTTAAGREDWDWRRTPSIDWLRQTIDLFESDPPATLAATAGPRAATPTR